MRRFLFLTLLMLALPLTVSAKIVPLINANGTLTGSDSGLSLNSTLTQIYFGDHGTDLDTLTIRLGPLISGNLATGGTFSSSGSSFLAIVNPDVVKGIPQGGVLFSGWFTGPVNCFPASGQPGCYELQGTIGGSWFYGFNVTGIVSPSYYGTFNPNGVFPATMGSGTSMINPEPGTLALFGTGFVGLAGIWKLSKMRRSKLSVGNRTRT